MTHSDNGPGTPKHDNWIKLAERIGSSFPNLREFVNSPSISRLKKIRYTYAVPVTIVGCVTSYVAYLFTGEQKETTKDQNIFLLEELVQKRARETWGNKDWKYDWSGVEFIPGKPDFTSTSDENVSAKSNVVFTATLKNESIVDQQHTLRTEKQHTATYKSSINKGFVYSKASLKIPSPDSIAEFGIFNDISLKETRNEKESKLVWAVEECITVPRQTSITVNMKTRENIDDFFFTTWVAVTGEVKATLCKDQHYFRTIPMSTIISQDFPKDMQKKENDIYYIKVQGNVNFRQEIDLEVLTK